MLPCVGPFALCMAFGLLWPHYCNKLHCISYFLISVGDPPVVVTFMGILYIHWACDIGLDEGIMLIVRAGS